MNHEKLARTARRLDFLFKYIQIVNCVAGILALCGIMIISFAYWLNPGSVNIDGYQTVDLGLVTLEQLPKGNTASEIVGLSYAWTLGFIGIVTVAAIYFACRYVRKILEPMMQGKPFDISVSENLRKLSFVSLGYGILKNICTMISTNAAVEHYGLERLAEAEHILSVQVNYSLEMEFLIVFLVLLLASYIFRYGAELQQLSDETL